MGKGKPVNIGNKDFENIVDDLWLEVNH